MKIDMRFRIHKRSPAGSEILMYAHRFNTAGPIHYFSNHTHGKNFTRYLFSQTRPHPANHLTIRNVAVEYAEGQAIPKSLTDPGRALQDFLGRRFPHRNADALLCDDGAYVFFCILSADGTIISNVVSPDGEAAAIDGELVSAYGGNAEDLRKIERMVLKGKRVIDFEGADAASSSCAKADALVQRLVSEVMGFEPILTVSHRDQLDHNQGYHIHRLIRMVEPESLQAGP